MKKAKGTNDTVSPFTSPGLVSPGFLLRHNESLPSDLTVVCVKPALSCYCYLPGRYVRYPSKIINLFAINIT